MDSWHPDCHRLKFTYGHTNMFLDKAIALSNIFRRKRKKEPKMSTFKIKIINEADPSKSREETMQANHQGELLKMLRQMGIKKFEIVGVDNDGSGQEPQVMSSSRPVARNMADGDDLEQEITTEKPAPLIPIPKELQGASPVQGPPQGNPGQPNPGMQHPQQGNPFFQNVPPRGLRILNTNEFENDGVKFKVEIWSDGNTVTYKKDWVDITDLSEYQVTIGNRTHVYKENSENKMSIRKLDWVVICDTRKKPESKEAPKKH